MNMAQAIRAALKNIATHGDTDIFPSPFERYLFFDRPDACASVLQEIDGNFDLLIEDGWVRQLGSSIQVEEGTDVFDASGLVVTPGLIDMHVHLREPGHEYKETIESGTRAAAAGGFTAVDR